MLLLASGNLRSIKIKYDSDLQKERKTFTTQTYDEANKITIRLLLKKANFPSTDQLQTRRIAPALLPKISPTAS